MELQPALPGYAPHRLPAKRPPTMRFVQGVVAAYFNLDARTMVIADRSRSVARPRQIAMYLVRRICRKSYPEIGRAFGGRDHSTVIYAEETIDRLRDEDAEIGEAVEELERMLSA